MGLDIDHYIGHDMRHDIVNGIRHDMTCSRTYMKLDKARDLVKLLGHISDTFGINNGIRQ